MLNNNGRLIAILPLGFLFRSGQDEDLRKYLIDQDLIDTIIQLPSNLFLNTSIPTICIVLNKDKSNRGKVRLFDASSFFKKANRNQVSLNFKILKGHLTSTSDSRFSKEINVREIEENNFNLEEFINTEIISYQINKMKNLNDKNTYSRRETISNKRKSHPIIYPTVRRRFARAMCDGATKTYQNNDGVNLDRSLLH